MKKVKPPVSKDTHQRHRLGTVASLSYQTPFKKEKTDEEPKQA